MINVGIFTASAFIYCAASLVYISHLFARKKTLGKAATLAMVAGFALQTVGYAVRWVETVRMGLDQTPLEFFTMYESLIFAAWVMALIYLFFEYKYKFKMLGAVIAPFVAALLFFASFSNAVNPAIQELPSVLRGNLFAHHAIASTAAFGCFIISFLVSIVIIVMGGPESEGSRISRFFSRFARVDVLDELSYKAIAAGFFLYTIGIATGVYRCKIVWGKYWSWDPSEISSLIMWLMYAVILHGRYQRWWGPRSTAMLSIAALITAVLCFLISAGLMLSSMHYPIN